MAKKNPSPTPDATTMEISADQDAYTATELGPGEAFEGLDDAESTPLYPGVYVCKARVLVPKKDDNGKPVASKLRVEKGGAPGAYFRIERLETADGYEMPCSGLGVYVSGSLRDVTTFKDGKSIPVYVMKHGRVVLGPDGKPQVEKVSALATLIRLLGHSPKGLKPRDIERILEETIDIPLGVRIDWQEAVTKNADGTFPKTHLRTSNFAEQIPEVDSTGNETGKLVARRENGVTIYQATVCGYLTTEVSATGKQYQKFHHDPNSPTKFTARAFASSFCELPRQS